MTLKGVSMVTYLSETVRNLTEELAAERGECMEQVKLVVMFADRWERERALADQLFEAMGAVQWAIPSSDPSLIIWNAAVAAHQEARRER
jgi:hypothetical protein